MEGEPFENILIGQNNLAFNIAGASSTILVRKEVEAFPFSSLLADCGGCLGLFIGFNFLMIWDWMLQALTFFNQKLTHTDEPRRFCCRLTKE